jgi:hypothetical protein
VREEVDRPTGATWRHRAARAIITIACLLGLLAPITLPQLAEASVSGNLVRFPANSPWVVATASDVHSSPYTAAMAIDGNTTTDWAANGYSVGDWWRATFGTPVRLDRVKLYPRDTATDNFGYGRIRFSDGTDVPFDLRGTTSSSMPITVDFPSKARVIWFEVVSDGGGGGSNPGLAEVEAFDVATSATTNLLRPPAQATYSAISSTGSATPDKAADGSTTVDWAVATWSAGTWWRVDWAVPQSLSRISVPRQDSWTRTGSDRLGS